MIKELLETVTEMMSPYLVYAVGGCVRDTLLGIEPKDYDFTTNALPNETEAKIKKDGRKPYRIGKKFGTLECKIDGHLVEITTFRTESYESGNRKPQVEFMKSLDGDLDRRDFTINAMAMRYTKKDNKLHLIDNHEGRIDLRNKKIRCVGNSKLRFKEDPLRILRGIRLATSLDFRIEEKTSDRMAKMSYLLLTISKERWNMELDKIIMDDNVKHGLIDLWSHNCFKYMIPELHLQMNFDQNSKYHSFELWFHTIYVVNALPKDLDLRLAGLFHDIGKPFTNVLNEKTGYFNYINHEIVSADITEKTARHLKWSNDRRLKVFDLVLNHLKEDSPLKKYDDMAKGDTDEQQRKTTKI